MIGERVIVTRGSKLRQSMEGSLNGDEHGGIGLEEVEDEVIKDDDKFRIIEPIEPAELSCLCRLRPDF